MQRGGVETVAEDQVPAVSTGRGAGPIISRRTALQAGLAGFGALWLSSLRTPSADAAAPTNPIVLENRHQGTTAWRLSVTSDDIAKQIKGYASATSVNLGDTIALFVTVNPAQAFTLDVYRIGDYKGTGGRLMLHDSVDGITQPDCTIDPSTGMASCNWSASYQLTVPTTWTTGIYLVKLTNSNDFQNYITFVVRDDSSTSALLYQQSVTTYQAYNNYPNDVPTGSSVPATGKSLYEYNSSNAVTASGTTRAVKVSFDRPYSNDDGAGDFLDWELFFVRWMESSGYDVSYCTDLDTHTNASQITGHRGLLSVGHDEYWSKSMYDGVTSALANGVGLGFFGANALYWQIRLEPNTAGVANRVQVCYKDATKDPVSGPTTTVMWRNAALNRPEQQLLGSMFVAQQPSGSAPAPFVVANSSNWLYAGTGVQDGDSIPGIVGYECDRSQAAVAQPNAVPGTYALLSDTVFTTSLQTTQHANATVYQAGSGAWVFNAGSIEWSWGLSDIGARTSSDPRIQRLTANVLDALAAGPADLPAAPSGLTATPVRSADVALAWTDNAGNESGFVVERSTSAAFESVVATTLPANTSSWTDSDLAPDVYYYRLRAVNGNGSSTYSENVFAATIAYRDLVLARGGLRSYWRLDESTGGVATDGKGTADGSYLNVALGIAGAIAHDPDTGAGFNGTSSKVSLPAMPSTVDFTVEGWGYLTAANVNSALYGSNGNVRILVRPGAGASAYAGVWLSGTEYALQPATAAANLNTWVHWVLTRAGATLSLYRNGVLIAQRTDLPTSAPANISGWIGAQTGNAYYFPGRIDDVAVYTEALGADAVADDYAAGSNGPTVVPPAPPAYRDLVLGTSALVAYWRLGEASGTVAVDSKGTANGTYVNAVALGAQGALANDPNPAAGFNGTNAKVSLPALPPQTDFSIEAWAYLTPDAVKNSNGNNALYASNNQVRLLVRPGATNTATDVLAGVWLNGTEYALQPTSSQSNLNTWVHWVLTRAGGTLTLYRNGTQVGQRTDLPAAATANVSGWIGAQGGTAYYLYGRVDEVAIYAAALRPGAVAAHYAAALNGPAPA